MTFTRLMTEHLGLNWSQKEMSSLRDTFLEQQFSMENYRLLEEVMARNNSMTFIQLMTEQIRLNWSQKEIYSLREHNLEPQFSMETYM
jgi:hypothetical protein